jgi:hypothetical protein
MQTSQLDHNPNIAPPKPAGKNPPTFKVFCEFGAVEARPKRALAVPERSLASRIGSDCNRLSPRVRGRIATSDRAY